MDRRNIIAVLFIVLVIILAMIFLWWPSRVASRLVVQTSEQNDISMRYYLFTDTDNGTTTKVVSDSIVVIALSDKSLGIPSVKDDRGNVIFAITNKDLPESVISFKVGKENNIFVSAVSTSTPNRRFSITLTPVSK